MDTERREKIKELLKDCSPACTCYCQGIEAPCKARDIGLNSFVECLEEKPLDCASLVSFGDSCYCLCAPRIYMAKELKT
jgi:hypothetical protein